MTKDKFNELLYRIQRGDRSALGPIFNEYYSGMKTAAYFILHNESDAEDAASEAMMKLIVYVERKKISERIDNPGGFMRTAVKTCALDILRKRKDNLSVDDLEVCATTDVSEQSIYRYDLIRALNGLDDRERELAIRHFMFGEKVKELNSDLDYRYDSLSRKLKEIRRKINRKL